MNMQPHPLTADDLNACVDGVLSGAEWSDLNTQIAVNPGLRQEMRELRATAMLLGQMPEVAPHRSFTLGPEFAREVPAPGKILQFLPIVRSLSVAAILAFMIVGGSLFFDIASQTGSDASSTFEAHNAILEHGVTEPEPGASDDAEDARVADAPAPAEDDESSMTSRGDAASVGDDPFEDLTSLEPAADSSDQVAQTADSEPTAPGVLSPDEERTSWIWASVVVGGLAIALAGLWLALARAGRQSHASKS